MPEKGVPAPFGALPAHFFRRPEKSKNCTNFAYFPWWAHGPYSPGLGPLLLSTRGGAIGILPKYASLLITACHLVSLMENPDLPIAPPRVDSSKDPKPGE